MTEKENFPAQKPPTRSWNFGGGIGRKLTIVMLIVTLLPVGFAIYYSSITFFNVLVESSIDQVGSNAHFHANEIRLKLDGFVADVHFLADAPQIQGIIRASNNGGFDPAGGLSDTSWGNLLATAFEEMAKENDGYLQIRYLDETGQEIVRVDSGKRDIYRVSEDKLQNKADRYYFADTMELDKDDTFYSPMDLNREGSPPEIVIPYKPVIRIATPILDDQTGDSKGIVIINMGVDVFFDSLHVEPSEKVGRINMASQEYVVGNEGYYFHHRDESKEWGAPGDLDTGENLTLDFPKEVATTILSEHGRGYLDLPELNLIIAYYSVHPNEENREVHWIFIEAVPRDFVLLPAVSSRNWMFAITAVFGSVVAIFALVFSRTLSGPVSELTQVALELSEGDLHARSRVKTKDELGILSKTFNKMADNLLDVRENLEEKVREKTKTLSIQNKELEIQQTTVLKTLKDVEAEKDNFKKQVLETRKFQQSIEHASDHIIITDPDGTIVYANKMASEKTGFAYNEIIGSKPSIWGKQMTKEFYDDLWKTIKTDKQPFEGEITNKKKDGTRYEANAHITPIFDDSMEIVFFVGIERDISKEKDLERLKDEFLAVASHELRTPLTAIDGLVSMMLGGEYGEMSNEMKQPLQDVNTSSARLIHLVNDLLSVSRLQAGRLKFELSEFDIKSTIENSLNLLSTVAEKKGLELTVGNMESVNVSADENKIKQIITNLVGNSLKFTEKGKVVVSLKKKGDLAYVFVKDTGIGMKEDSAKRIFGKFQQLDGGRGRAQGTGLGLYITRELCKKMGGDLVLETTVFGKGTIFIFSVPLARSKLAEEVKERIKKEAAANPDQKSDRIEEV